jgi:hypothetical protein
MKLSHKFLKSFVRALRRTRPVEIGCDECFAELDVFAEEKLAGRDPAEALPLVAEHLERCGNCREEFEALLAALEVLNEPPSLKNRFASLRRR